jgi:hypothetical protein
MRDNLQHLSSPVAVAVRIRQDLAEFQRTGGSKQALLESLREDYIAARQQQADTPGGVGAAHPTVVEHLEQRGLIRDPRRRRLFSVINNPGLSNSRQATGDRA